MLSDNTESTTKSSEDDILLAHVLSLDLEKDKQLLTLSAAGIGLLGTFLAAKGAANIAEIVICCGGLLCFVAAIRFLLNSFQLNKEFTDQTLQNDADSPEVKRASRALYREQQKGSSYFYAGTFLSAIFALVTASNSFEINQVEKSKQLIYEKSERKEKIHAEISESLSKMEKVLASIEAKIQESAVKQIPSAISTEVDK
jgi:hypothetical protein